MHARPIRRTTSGVLSVLLASAGCVALAGTATAAPTTTSAPATKAPVALSLINGWTSEDSVYGTGEPAVSVDAAGIVHLSGSLANGTAGDPAFVLPTKDRPSKNLYVTDYTLDGSTGFLVVTTDGSVYPEGSDATNYTSLAAITFPSAGTGLGFIDVGLENGWVSEDSTYGTGDPAVAREPSGVVHLSGSLAEGTTDSVAFVLPTQDRPASTLYLDMYTFSGSTGILVIGTDGSVAVEGSQASSYTSLVGVTFPSATSTLKLKKVHLINKWKGGAYGTGSPAAVRDSSGIVHLAGGLSGGTTSSDAFVLPAADAPSHTLYITTYTFDGAVGFLVVEPDGDVYPFGPTATSPQTTANEFTSLASVTFPAGV